ncbi:hypothetical protein ACFLW5_02175 [Chloroflexota bacterium]
MRQLHKRRFRPFRGQRGISLLETLIAVGILAAVGLAFMSALDTNARAGRTLDEQLQAVNLATSYLEAIRELPYDYVNPEYSDASDNITIPAQYNVDIDVDYSSDGTIWVDTYTDEHLQKITIAVSREGGKPILILCTLRCER